MPIRRLTTLGMGRTKMNKSMNTLGMAHPIRRSLSKPHWSFPGAEFKPVPRATPMSQARFIAWPAWRL